jgi:hypothetical protein
VLDARVLGSYAHGSPPKHRVRVYLMHVEQELATWPEQRERQRRWIPLCSALTCVAEPGLRDLLSAAARRLS